MPPLILASTSPYRRQLLERLGCPFQCVAPAIDEETLKDPRLAPQALAEHLARAKAESIRPRERTAFIVGSDQLVSCEGKVLGKPGDRLGAIEQLTFLAGRVHELITALCVLVDKECHTHTDITRLTMRPLTRDAIERYVAVDQPYDCAGAYKLEQHGIALFERIESADHSAITGLPLIALGSILRDLGLPIP